MGGGGVRSCSMEQHFKFVAASECASYVLATCLPQRKLGEQLFRHRVRTRVARVRAEYPDQLDYSGAQIFSTCIHH